MPDGFVGETSLTAGAGDAATGLAGAFLAAAFTLFLTVFFAFLAGRLAAFFAVFFAVFLDFFAGDFLAFTALDAFLAFFFFFAAMSFTPWFFVRHKNSTRLRANARVVPDGISLCDDRTCLRCRCHIRRSGSRLCFVMALRCRPTLCFGAPAQAYALASRSINHEPAAPGGVSLR